MRNKTLLNKSVFNEFLMKNISMAQVKDQKLIKTW